MECHSLPREGHPPGGEARHPPIGGRHSPTLHGGWAPMHGGQRPISPQVLIKLSRPPSLCRQCTPAVFLGSINTCCNRNASSLTASICENFRTFYPLNMIH